METGWEVGGEVGGIVTAWVDVEFVGDVAGGEGLVERGGAGFEAVVVLRAAIEINFQAGEIGGAGESDGAVAIPEGGVGRKSEDAAENAGARRGGGVVEESGEGVHERGAVGADGGEELGMTEGEMERAVSAHGDAGDGAMGAAGSDAIVFFDEGKKFLEQEIFVAIFAIAGVDVEAGVAVGSDDEEILELVFVAQVFD